MPLHSKLPIVLSTGLVDLRVSMPQLHAYAVRSAVAS
jgi:hypothetical protein